MNYEILASGHIHFTKSWSNVSAHLSSCFISEVTKQISFKFGSSYLCYGQRPKSSNIADGPAIVSYLLFALVASRSAGECRQRCKVLGSVCFRVLY
jgi:hypothetical protein